MTRLIAVCGPETGGVRGEHLVTQHHISILVQAELKLGIRNDDTLAQCVLCTFLVQGDGVVTKLFCKLLPSAREIFFEMVNTLLKRDIFIMITNLGFG